MPLFTTYVMVDWSGGDRRRANRQDCIWIAHGPRTAPAPATVSPASRTEAAEIVRGLLRRVAASRTDRALVCADFAYGYPAGFARLLPGLSADAAAGWRRVWKYFAATLRDDIGTKAGRKPTNRSNRFDVASAINASLRTRGLLGPFWCLSEPGSRRCIPQNRPAQPFRHGGVSIEPLRITDRRARSDTPFRLFGTGSVGSQVLTGIPRLERLRSDPSLSPCSAVWPFETGWAPRGGAWPREAQRIVHAEIYPSVREPLEDAIKDRGQVRAMWRWARNLDAQGLLVNELAIPSGIESGSADDVLIRDEEGWILGCPAQRSVK